MTQFDDNSRKVFQQSQTRWHAVQNKTPASRATIRTFRSIIWKLYRASYRPMPWRETHDPYAILVSEFMLQQTQVDRVRPKYDTFLENFPTVGALARASLPEVLGCWQGLGYNRRAVNLKRTAEHIVQQYNAQVPARLDDLLTLPGVGRSTAAGVLNFAFNTPTPFLETNIRTVLIYFFYPDQHDVGDDALMRLAEITMDTSDTRQWFYAMMDAGVIIKKHAGNISRQGAAYRRQSRFEGSDRQLRAAVVRTLLTHTRATTARLADMLDADTHRLSKLLDDLAREGMICRRGRSWQLAS